MTINVINVTTPGEINRDTFLQFDVQTTDSSPFTCVFVSIEFPGSGVVEFVYAQDPAQGGPYEKFYANDSTVEEIAGAPGFTTFRWTLRRQADGQSVWPDSPMLRVYAGNTAGEKVTPTSPFAANYLVVDLAPDNPFATPGVTPFISGSFLAGCDASFDDQTYFLGVLERAYPQSYVEGLRSKPAGGYELFQAAAKTAERMSIAVNRLECCAFLMTSEGGARATGTVELYREDPGGVFPELPEITVKAGSVVRTKFGRDFVILDDAFFEGFTQNDPHPPLTQHLGPFTVRVEAVDVGWEYNVPGSVVARNGEVLPGEISEVKCLIIEPASLAHASLGILVRQIVPTEDGQAACLDGLAEDLDITRIPLEGDDAFLVRIKETQDTVSPGAICRGVDKILQGIDPTLECCLREVGKPLLPGIFYDAGSSSDLIQAPATNFAYDMDPSLRPEDRFKYYLSTIDMRGFFLVGIPPIKAESDFGMAYDGSDGDTWSLRNAYDDNTPTNGDAAYDGFPVFSGAVHQSIFDMISAKKACGVGFDLYVEDVGCF